MSERVAPPGFYEFSGQSPDGQGGCFFVVAKEAILKHYRDTGNSVKYLESFLIPEVLASPTGTWKNLERYGQEAAMCYTGLPEGRFQKDETLQIPIPPDKVFAVFISGRQMRDGQYRVTKWTWIDADPGRPGFPVDHSSRFGERLWPQD